MLKFFYLCIRSNKWSIKIVPINLLIYLKNLSKLLCLITDTKFTSAEQSKLRLNKVNLRKIKLYIFFKFLLCSIKVNFVHEK